MNIIFRLWALLLGLLLMAKDLGPVRGQVDLYRFANNKIAEYTEIKRKAREAIEAELGDDDTGTIDGQPAVTKKVHKRTSVDQGYIKKHFPEVHAEAQKTSEVTRFEVAE